MVHDLKRIQNKILMGNLYCIQCTQSAPLFCVWKICFSFQTIALDGDLWSRLFLNQTYLLCNIHNYNTYAQIKKMPPKVSTSLVHLCKENRYMIQLRIPASPLAFIELDYFLNFGLNWFFSLLSPTLWWKNILAFVVLNQHTTIRGRWGIWILSCVL